MKFTVTGTVTRLAAVAVGCLPKKWTRKVSVAFPGIAIVAVMMSPRSRLIVVTGGPCPPRTRDRRPVSSPPLLGGGKPTGKAITWGRRDGNTGERGLWDSDGHARCRLSN